MQTKFLEKLERAQSATGSDIVLMIAPVVMKMPLPIRRYDDPFLPFGKAVIQATRDHVCGYAFDLAAYLAIGAAGAIALERTLSLISGDRLTILHGLFAGVAYATISDEIAFVSDAVTLADDAHLSDYLARDDRSAFVLNGSLESYPVGVGVLRMGAFDLRGAGGDSRRLRVAGDDVLYAGSGDDFTEQIVARLVTMKGEA